MKNFKGYSLGWFYISVSSVLRCSLNSFSWALVFCGYNGYSINGGRGCGYIVVSGMRFDVGLLVGGCLSGG